MRDCQQSRALDILILVYIPSLNTAISHKNKTEIKQEVPGAKRAWGRSGWMSETFVVTAALNCVGKGMDKKKAAGMSHSPELVLEALRPFDRKRCIQYAHKKWILF